ncbi:MAG: tetratricopeptide repeat protein, partial [Gammaproteobacteria bacterium]|nr:tetratricopeptide repeat protein [Gammaproteobacteria bacterium]
MPHKPLILKGQSRTGAGSVVNGAGTGGALVRVGPARLRIWPPRSVIGLVMGLLSAGPLQAGGSAETTLVVVNTHSTESRQVANHYVALRDIPPTHVVWLDQVPASPRIDIQAFRERIWKPVRAHLKTHGLEDHIDVIAYSAGFPYAVDFSRDLRGESIPKANRRFLGKVGSLTGLTFFAHRVEAGDLGYLGLNLYFRRNLSAETRAPRPTNEEEEALFQRAQKLVKRKQYEEAVAELEKLTDAYRWSAPAWYDLAVSQAALERDGEAMRSLEKAVEAGWRHSLTARSERRFKRLRESPRFQALIERMQQQHTVFQPAHGFRGHYVWHGGFRPQRHGPRDSLNRYFLSVMLGYTGFQGNSVHEVLDYLTRAAESDGSHPDGTVYLLENRNIRAQARERYFHATLRALKERGRRVEIISRRDGQDGIVPRNRHDVMGAVVGTAKFDWNRANSQFLPGAIAESLTSYGGHFERRK